MVCATCFCGCPFCWSVEFNDLFPTNVLLCLRLCVASDVVGAVALIVCCVCVV